MTGSHSTVISTKQTQIEKAYSLTIHDELYSADSRILNLKKISASQWGGIRAYATKAKSIELLKQSLFDKDTGYLTHGIADEKYWGKNKGANRKAFEDVFSANEKHGTTFIAKFAAEMAKETRKNK